MRSFLKLLFILVLFAAGCSENVREETEKSFLTVIPGVDHDSTIVISLIQKGSSLVGSPDSALLFFRKALVVYRNTAQWNDMLLIRMLLLKGDVLRLMGNTYDNLAHYDSSLVSYYEGELIYKKIIELQPKMVSARIGLAKIFGNISIVYLNKGSYDLAVLNFFKAMNQYEEIDQTSPEMPDVGIGISKCLNGIGNVFAYQKNYEKATGYYLLSMKRAEKHKDLKMIENNLRTIGSVFIKQKKYSMARNYFSRALTLAEQLKDKRSISACYSGLIIVAQEERRYTEALDYFNKSVKLKEELNDKKGLAFLYLNHSNFFFNQTQVATPVHKRELFINALEFALKARAIAIEIQSVDLQRNTAYQLLGIMKNIGRYREALEFAAEFIALNDSIFKDEKIRSVSDAEKKFETEKKQLTIEKLNKEKELQRSELLREQAISSRQRLFIGFFVFGIVVLLLFAMAIVDRLKITRRQKQFLEQENMRTERTNQLLHQQNEEIITQRDEIETQRDLVLIQKSHIEEQKKMITDSINYARRIQNAILPEGDYAKSILGDHFIFFKPKDIVSGDFFWATHINNLVVLAVADCTGHGVPGGFMSMLGFSFLNEIVRKNEVLDAAGVLDYLRRSIIDALKQKGLPGEQKDGMDIALVAINPEERTIQYAGANLPLLLIKTDMSLIEIKPDKQPVAIYYNMKPFTNHRLDYSVGDMLYLFSDGFQDQFGGDVSGGRKFMAKRLKEMLVTLAQTPVDHQILMLESAFNSWKGDHDQVDDVTVVGVRLS